MSLRILLTTLSFLSWTYVAIDAFAAGATPSAPAVNKVAVAGATGRTGSLVVQELLDRNVNVVALVRDLKRANESLPTSNDKLSVLQCDLANEGEILSSMNGCDAAIWAATGFSDNPDNDWLVKVKKLLGVALTPRQTIDAVGVPALAKFFSGSADDDGGTPKVVMLSSAGVSRPRWQESKKEKFIGAADIPIVRLNPFGILDIKADCEEDLRKSGTKYCIVRPCGLNDEWPTNSRPVLSQGDVAVGRINRKDVARILVDCLYTSEAEGKTFECFTMQGYKPALSIDKSLSLLYKDLDGLPEAVVAANYALLQQLLPGEKQDSAALAMGQTYEQLDKEEQGRFGERGTEDAEGAIGGELEPKQVQTEAPVA